MKFSSPISNLLYRPYFHKIYKFLPISAKFKHFSLISFNLRVFASLLFFTMMHLRIIRTGLFCIRILGLLAYMYIRNEEREVI